MIIELILILLSVPSGFLIAWLARDELFDGRKYFRILIIASIIGIIGFWLFGFSEIAWTCGFIGIISLIAFLKGSDKKWTGKKA